MNKSPFRKLVEFVAMVTVVHTVTYSLVGWIVYATGATYGFKEQFGYEVDCFLRPITDPLVIAGPLFQLIRGPIIALALFPFRGVFFERKRGWLYLWGLFIGLAVLGTAGPAPGSVEGMVYTTFPFLFHFTSYPEVVVQTLAFSWLLCLWEKRKDNKRLTYLFVFLFILSIVFPVLGLVFSS